MSEGVCGGQKRALTGSPGSGVTAAEGAMLVLRTESAHCEPSLQLSQFLKTVKDNLSLLSVLIVQNYSPFNYIHDDIDFNPSEILILLFYINAPKSLKHLTMKPNQHRI